MDENRETRTADKGTLSFGRRPPRTSLRSFIRNYWVLGPTNRPDGLSRLRIVPDGFIDIVFVRPSPAAGFQAYVAGTMTRPIFEELCAHVEYVGIRFAPGGFTGLFGVPVDDLTDRIVPLGDLMTPFVPMDQISDGVGAQARLAILDDALAHRVVPRERNAVLTRVVEAIFARRGAISVTQLARIAGWSPRHLRRAFCGLVGVTPKAFCRIVRFKTALRMLRCGSRSDLLDVALDAGYYDQAHFSHDFRGFYGASPSTVRKKPEF